MRARESNRPGFGLFEVIVALVVAALVLMAARSILESVANGAERLVDAAGEMDRVGNADRLLRLLVGQVESGTIVPGAVAGDERRVRFQTWCDVPAGWKERCGLELAFAPSGSGEALIVSGLPGGPRVLRTGFRFGSLRYLEDPAKGGVWLPRWSQQLTVPLAIGVILDADTVILRIGERG